MFKANRDRDTQVSNAFWPVIDARYIRVHPKVCHGHISMRVELLGSLSGICTNHFPVVFLFINKQVLSYLQNQI